MTRFENLKLWKDPVFRTPAEQMALDEALFDLAVLEGEPILRCYHWDQHAITLGYFSHWETADEPGTSVRRWTGGGRVEHGEDLTFSLMIPNSEPLSKLKGPERYTRIHACMSEALSSTSIDSHLHPETTGSEIAVSGPNRCFAAPVASDLMGPHGNKIAGGAQRRIGGAILHQGSIRLPLPLRAPKAPWIQQFCLGLSKETSDIDEERKDRALSGIEAKLESRYGLSSWNRLR